MWSWGDVANPFGEVVFGELEGDPLDCLRGLHHRGGVGEALQIVGEAVVGLGKDRVLEPGRGVGGEGYPGFGGELNQGGDAERSVQVDMDIGLGNFFQEGSRNVTTHYLKDWIYFMRRSFSVPVNR